jgi:hypothetical protein
MVLFTYFPINDKENFLAVVASQEAISLLFGVLYRVDTKYRTSAKFRKIYKKYCAISQKLCIAKFLSNLFEHLVFSLTKVS